MRKGRVGAYGSPRPRPDGGSGSGDKALLDAYSETCLSRVWRAQRFSWWMTSMLHRFDRSDPFQLKVQQSELDYVTTSRAAATTIAENHVGAALG